MTDTTLTRELVNELFLYVDGDLLWRIAQSSKAALSDEEIIVAAVSAKLHDEMWVGPHTPEGYEDTLPKLHAFARATPPADNKENGK